MSDMSGRFLVGRRATDQIPHVISDQTLEFLPFKSESIDAWTSGTDLNQFLIELFNQPSVITAPDGSKHESNFSHFGAHLFEEGITAMTQLAKEFSEASKHVHHQDPKKIPNTEYDFLKDPHFGRAAKALVACEAWTVRFFRKAPLFPFITSWRRVLIWTVPLNSPKSITTSRRPIVSVPLSKMSPCHYISRKIPMISRSGRESNSGCRDFAARADYLTNL